MSQTRKQKSRASLRKTRSRNGGHHPFIIPLILLSGKYSMRRNDKNRKTRKRRVRKMLKKIKKKNKSRFSKR